MKKGYSQEVKGGFRNGKKQRRKSGEKIDFGAEQS
jgi:hypothetical protein